MRRLMLLLGAVAVTAAFGLIVPSSDAAFGEPGLGEPEWLYSDFLRTAHAAARDHLCEQQYGSGHTCVEWCDVFQGGIIVPHNNFCCEDDGNEFCTQPLF